MKKETFIMTVEYNEEGDNLLEKLNLTIERAEALVNMAEKDCDARGEGTPEKPFDSFESLIRLMNSGELTGNEMFLFLINGYTIDMKMRLQKHELIQALTGGL